MHAIAGRQTLNVTLILCSNVREVAPSRCQRIESADFYVLECLNLCKSAAYKALVWFLCANLCLLFSEKIPDNAMDNVIDSKTAAIIQINSQIDYSSLGEKVT